MQLKCRATGIPQPRVTWRREDQKEIIIREPLSDKSTGSNEKLKGTYIYVRARVSEHILRQSRTRTLLPIMNIERNLKSIRRRKILSLSRKQIRPKFF